MPVANVIDLNGVGPALAEALNTYGVFTTADLLRVRRQRLADRISGISVAQVRRWQAISELLPAGTPAAPVSRLQPWMPARSER